MFIAARKRASIFLIMLLTTTLAGACGVNVIPPEATAPATTVPITATPATMPVEVIFEVDLPDGTPTGQGIFIDLLDEVTGLALNPQRFQMERTRPQHYSVSIPVIPGSLVKYRFTRGTRPIYVEYNCLRQQVRYRLLYVTGHDTAHDVVCQWNDLEVEGTRGRILGRVTDTKTNAPLPNIQVQAGGVTTLTASDGSYLLEGLPPGTHNLIAASMNGGYRPYQQGAVVAEDATTPAPLALTAAPLVRVKFMVSLPTGDNPDLPLFLLGNISAMGNTFADLAGGVNVVAYQAVKMAAAPDGRFSFEIELPAGLDLRYKYTRGDGFWNAELTSTGGFVTRQLIVPETDITVEDEIQTWAVRDHAAVTFTLQTPNNTPPADVVSIQLSAFGWTEPIPMWPLGKNRWRYILQNPLHLMDTVQYRFCRNNLCSVADDRSTVGALAKGEMVAVTAEPQEVSAVVEQWAWWGNSSQLVTVEPDDRGVREDLFMVGAEFLPNYHPAWETTYQRAYSDLKDVGVSWVYLTPTWHYSQNNPPVLEPQPGKSPLWENVEATALQAKQAGFNIAVFPLSIHSSDDETWWLEAKRDSDWWTRWFERYETFVLSHADLAEKTGAAALVLGEPGIEPALPGGTLRDGTPSGIPAGAAEWWDGLIAAVRQRYKGQLIWAASYPGGMKTPEFVSQFDQIYVIWSAPLAKTDNPTVGELSAEFARRLVKDILPLREQTSKPIQIGLAFPSVNGGVMGCFQSSQRCLPFSTFDQPYQDDPAYELDLAEQADIYQAVLEVISLPDNAWITGLITRRYYPAAALQDKSSSIHGKPAEEMLSAWLKYLAEVNRSN